MKRLAGAGLVLAVVIAASVVLAAMWFFVHGARMGAAPGAGPTGAWEGEMAVPALANAPAGKAAGPGAVAVAQGVERKIIKSGRLELLVADLDAAVDQIRRLAEEAGGFVASQSFTTEPTGWRQGQVSVRIPSPGFDGAIEELQKCGQVAHLYIGTEDVTEEFVDLEARLRNLEREEEVLLDLFKRPSKLPDVLAVERELARVRGELEQAQGRLRYLKHKVSLSTIDIDLNEMGEAIIGPTGRWRLAYHAYSAGRVLVAVLRVLVTAIIYVVVVGVPLWVVLGAWVLVRRVRRRGGR